MTPLQVAKPIVVDLMAAIAFAAVFFVARKLLHWEDLESVYAAAGAGIAIAIAQFFHKKLAGQPIGPLQWLSAGVVIILGTMTIALHNGYFIKLKPTAIDLAAGLFMLTRDWMTPYMPEEERKYIPRRTIMWAEKAWGVLMIAFAAINVPVAFLFDSTVWVVYATFVPTTIVIVLFFVQYSTFKSLARRNAQAGLVASAS